MGGRTVEGLREALPEKLPKNQILRSTKSLRLVNGCDAGVRFTQPGLQEFAGPRSRRLELMESRLLTT